jgi:hypothetical protein
LEDSLAGSRDDLARKIRASCQQFRASIMDWSAISERLAEQRPPL